MLESGQARGASSEDALSAAYRQAYTTPSELAARLKTFLGRPLLAYMLDIGDVGVISQWADGTLVPEDALRERLRTIAAVFAALERLAGDSAAAAGWFTGANPSFAGGMPAEQLRAGHDAAVCAAVRALAEAG